jgi:hypothetical protein
MASIPGLNTRETALVVWACVLLVFLLTKAEVRSSFASTLRVIFGSRFLSSVIVSAGAYAAGTVLLLRHVSYWEGEMTRTAVVWFFGIGIVAVFNTKRTDTRYFRRLVLDNLALAAVVEFVVNLDTFPLPVELVLVPLAFLFVGTQVVAESDPDYAPARKLIAACLTLLGLASLSFSLAYAFSHFDQIATGEKVKDFLLPLTLTACFLPYLYGLRMVVVWQTMLHMIHFNMRENEPLYRFTRRAIANACGASLGRAQLFEERFRGRLWGVGDKAEVSRVVDEFRVAVQARHTPEQAAGEKAGR